MNEPCPNLRAARIALDDDLHGQWRNLRNDVRALPSVVACVDMLHRCGIIDTAARELWMRRLPTCPGHDDEGGRAWCAYCGDMPDGGTDGDV